MKRNIFLFIILLILLLGCPQPASYEGTGKTHLEGAKEGIITVQDIKITSNEPDIAENDEKGVNVSYLFVGNTMTLPEAILTPYYVDNAGLAWESSADSILTVDEKGTITAVSYGEASVMVSSQDGDFSTVSNIAVYVPTTSVTIVPKPTDENIPIITYAGETWTGTLTGTVNTHGYPLLTHAISSGGVISAMQTDPILVEGKKVLKENSTAITVSGLSIGDATLTINSAVPNNGLTDAVKFRVYERIEGYRIVKGTYSNSLKNDGEEILEENGYLLVFDSEDFTLGTNIASGKHNPFIVWESADKTAVTIGGKETQKVEYNQAATLTSVLSGATGGNSTQVHLRPYDADPDDLDNPDGDLKGSVDLNGYADSIDLVIWKHVTGIDKHVDETPTPNAFYAGESITLRPIVQPENEAYPSVTWTTNQTGLITNIPQTGIVVPDNANRAISISNTNITNGDTATITVTSNDPGVEHNTDYEVLVYNHPTISIPASALDDKILPYTGDSFQLNTQTSTNSDYVIDGTVLGTPLVTWSAASGNATVNTIGNTITIDADGAGSTTIRATLSYNRTTYGQDYMHSSITDAYTFTAYNKIISVAIGSGNIDRYFDDNAVSLTATTTPPADLGPFSWSWTSDNTGVATTTGNSAAGTISPAGTAGTADITVTTTQSELAGYHQTDDSFTLTTHNHPSISIPVNALDGKISPYTGDSFQLNTQTATNSDYVIDGTVLGTPSVAWSVVSGNASVSNGGDTFTVDGAGDITIRATLNYGIDKQYIRENDYTTFTAYNKITSLDIGSGDIERYSDDNAISLIAIHAHPGDIGPFSWNWTSGNTGVATTTGNSAAGTISPAGTAGTADITVTTTQSELAGYHQTDDSFTLTTHNHPSISIPVNALDGKISPYTGDSFQLNTQTATNSDYVIDGTVLGTPSVAWSVVSGNASVSNGGDTFTVDGAGDITIRATLNYGIDKQYIRENDYTTFTAYNKITSLDIGSGDIERYSDDNAISLIAIHAHPGDIGPFSWNWTSGNTGVATTTGNSAAGTISPAGTAGTADITVTTTQSELAGYHQTDDSFTLTTHNHPSISIEDSALKAKISPYVGDSFQLNNSDYTITGTVLGTPSVAWSVVSGNASVSSGDTITVDGAGSITIRATMSYGIDKQYIRKTDYSFTAHNKITSVDIGSGDIERYSDDNAISLIAIHAHPGDIGPFSWNWTSGNTGVATTTGNSAAGTISPAGTAGTADITVTTTQSELAGYHQTDDSFTLTTHNHPSISIEDSALKAKISPYVGDSFQLNNSDYTITGTVLGTPSVAWSVVSGNASVSSGDTITVDGAGSITIRATMSYGIDKQYIRKTDYSFTAHNKITSVDIGSGDIERYSDDNAISLIAIHAHPGDIGPFSWNWTSDNTAVATATGSTEAGIVSPAGTAGTAVITVTATQNQWAGYHQTDDSFTLTTHNHPSISIEDSALKAKISPYVGDSFQLNNSDYTITGTVLGTPSVAWSVVSGNASVSSGDTITVDGAGSITIRATMSYGIDKQYIRKTDYSFTAHNKITSVDIGSGDIERYSDDNAISLIAIHAHPGDIGPFSWNWTSDNTAVATATGSTEAGIVSPAGTAGTAVITVTATQNQWAGYHQTDDSFTLSTHNHPSISIKDSALKAKISPYVGDSFQLNNSDYTITGTVLGTPSVAWSVVSGNASVSSGDTITVDGAGDITIRATMNYGIDRQYPREDDYTFTAYNFPSFAITPKDNSVNNGNIITVDSEAQTGTGYKPVTYTWTITAGAANLQIDGDNNNASVSVRGINPGNATLQVEISDGVKTQTATCTITVN